MRSTQTWGMFAFVVVLTAFAVLAVWPSEPGRYLPGDFWPSGRGIKIGGWERETMRLGLDLRGGAQLVLEADPPDDYEGDLGSAMSVAREVMERRVNEFGVSEAEIQQTSGNRLTVQIPDMPLDDAERLIGQTAQLEFRVYNAAGELVPATGIVDGQVLEMTGQYLKNNTFPSRSGTEFMVNFETTSTGAKLMEQITTQALQYPQTSLQNQLLIFLDDELISSARVNGVISSSGVITGQRSFSTASEFSKQLNAGALPIPLRTIQANEVSATLGEDSVVDSVHAGEIGLIAVALFMILFYRLPGLVAAVALGVYTALILMVFKLWPVTLTLSGIAAFVLSIGMAVDANILIFERMKEELRRGRTLNTAIDLGFRRAWTSIRDSNVSTLITCLILYWFGDQFGASLVKGFALTLAIGVAVSMFSAITVTRTFLKLIVGTRLARNGWLFNAHEEKHDAAAPVKRTWIDFSGKRWWTLGFSLATFIVAVVILAIPPSLKAGIEFTSGSSFTLRFENPVEQGDLRDAMSDLGHPGSRIQGAGENTYLIRTEELEGAPALDADVAGPVPPGEIDTIEAGLRERFGPLERQDFSTVSGTVSSEIARNAALAVIVAAIAILIYIAIVFRQLPNPWKYGAAAVISMIHDAVVILGLFSLLGKLFDTEVDTAFITAILTVIGFSVHDTIVVFDRMRERLSHDAFLPFDEAVNASLTETLARSINTSTVVVLTVTAMLLIGGVTIRDFLIVLLVGIVAGTYSSIGVAAQLLVAWEKRDFSRLLGRGKPVPRTEESPAGLEAAN